jgi:hypothetical protein
MRGQNSSSSLGEITAEFKKILDLFSGRSPEMLYARFGTIWTRLAQEGT